MTIGNRIKELREQKNMSQDELAQAVGYKSRSTIGKIELGKMDITQSAVVALAKALGTTPGYLMGWDKKSHEQSKRTDEFAELFEKLSVEQQELLIKQIKGILSEK